MEFVDLFSVLCSFIHFKYYHFDQSALFETYASGALGPGFILDDLPQGPGFCISIKLCLVQ